MVVLSRLPSLLALKGICGQPATLAIIQRRGMGGGGPRVMNITPSRWQWHKFKDMLHFYFMLGLIPIGTLVFLVNVFVGPATLAPTPEDYTPKHWEYYRHPISRFLARYVYTSHQQDYEKYLHVIYEEHEKVEMRRIEQKVKQLMYERGDSQAHYFRPVFTKYHRFVRDEYEKMQTERGF